ncbi:hypothetical protein AB0A63_24520 [Lentzea sp. NPDC042327]|uniref:hypothetical protein n=1 Tax=Lentzea sp. NPDC042327 TaxID=3154801 RepID=UPI0033C0512E
MIEGTPGSSDGEETAGHGRPVGPGVPEQAPGSPSRLRLVAESSAAQREPLEDAAERVRGIDTTHWSSAARDGYLRRRDELAGQWRAALDVHRAVSERIGEHSTFVHELRHLWAAYDKDEDQQRHLQALHDTKAAELKQFLVEQAEKLDRLALAPDPVGVPDEADHPAQPPEAPPSAEHEEPGSEEQEEPAEPDEAPDDAAQDDPAADDGPVATFGQQLRERELLTRQLHDGNRVERIPYDGLVT